MTPLALSPDYSVLPSLTHMMAGKTRVLVIRDTLPFLAIDASINTSQAQELYEELKIGRWQSKNIGENMQECIIKANCEIRDLRKKVAASSNILLHLRVRGTRRERMGTRSHAPAGGSWWWAQPLASYLVAVENIQSTSSPLHENCVNHDRACTFRKSGACELGHSEEQALVGGQIPRKGRCSCSPLMQNEKVAAGT